MAFKYSICYPDKEEIQYPSDLLERNQVIELAKNYPWSEQLKISNNIKNEVFYSPSLDFTNIKTKHSFCLTADSKNEKLNFSLWYNRPKKVKVLFGLFGEAEKMMVDDVWSFSFEDSLKYLEYFVDGNYRMVERLYEK